MVNEWVEGSILQEKSFFELKMERNEEKGCYERFMKLEHELEREKRSPSEVH
jgi:hypothetical protein